MNFQNIKKTVVPVFLLIIISLSTLIFVACPKREDDYPVAGIWHAHATWHEDSPFNYGGDNYVLDIYFEFREDGTLRNKRTLTVNDYELKDDFSDWVILNLTWTVNGNIITLSSGKTYVIVDNQFDDTYANPQLILHYKKETTNHSNRLTHLF